MQLQNNIHAFSCKIVSVENRRIFLKNILSQIRMTFVKKTSAKVDLSESKRDNIQSTKDILSDSSSSTNNSSGKRQLRQTEAMQKLAKNFKKKTSEKKQPDSWQSLINNLLHSQRGKLPLLLAVEAGNQSMVRELLSAQTTEQLKVS